MAVRCVSGVAAVFVGTEIFNGLTPEQADVPGEAVAQILKLFGVQSAREALALRGVEGTRLIDTNNPVGNLY